MTKAVADAIEGYIEDTHQASQFHLQPEHLMTDGQRAELREFVMDCMAIQAVENEQTANRVDKSRAPE